MSNSNLAQSVYEFEVKKADGSLKSLGDYKGKALLIVNVASQCGFTRQYAGLEDLYQKYQGKLEVLGFPCNQFGGQEPGTNDEIQSFCQLQKVTFPIFGKIDVNGKDEDPLYKYLKSEKSGFLVDAIKWNFTKFLIDAEGKPVKRYGSSTEPKDIDADVANIVQ